VQHPKRKRRGKKYSGVGVPADTITTQISSTIQPPYTTSAVIYTQSSSTSTQPSTTSSTMSMQNRSTSAELPSDLDSITEYSRPISLAPVSQWNSDMRTPTPESRSSRLDITDAAETMEEILSLYV